MHLTGRFRKIYDVEIFALADVPLTPTSILSRSISTVSHPGTVSSLSAGPESLHLKETGLNPTIATLAATSFKGTSSKTSSTSSPAPNIPSFTTAAASTFTAPTSISTTSSNSSRTVIFKAPASLGPAPSSSSDMAVSKSSTIPITTTHSTTASSNVHTSTSNATLKSSNSLPLPSSTVSPSTHSSATHLSTQRAEPTVTPSPTSSPDPAPPASSTTNSNSQGPGTSDLKTSSTIGAKQSPTSHSTISTSSAAKSPTNPSPSGLTTTNDLKGSPPSTARPASSTSTASHGGSTSSSSSSLSSLSSTSSAPTAGETIHTSEAISRNWNFFDNKKAVAGVFVVVGLALLLAIVGLLFYCRSLRIRRQRRSAAFQNISQPITTYRPTGSLHEGLMVETERESSHRHLISSPDLKYSDDVSIHRSASQSSHVTGEMQSIDSPGRAGIGALGLTGMRTPFDSLPIGRRMVQPLRYDGPFSDYHLVSTRSVNGFTRPILPQPDVSTVGTAISGMEFPGGTESMRNVKSRFSAERAPSPAPSTPSIYPPSLPAQEEADDPLFYENEMRRSIPLEVTVTPPLNLKVPQKVHFNELRRETPASDPFADPDPDSVDDLFYLESQPDRVPPPKIDTRQIYHPDHLTPTDSTGGDTSATTPSTIESLDAKTNPFAAAFLGRTVVGKIEPWTRPPRSPLRNPSVSSRVAR